MKISRFFLILCALFLTGCMGAATGTPSPTPMPVKGTLRLGLVLPPAGPWATERSLIQHTVDLAVHQANMAHTVPGYTLEVKASEGDGHEFVDDDSVVAILADQSQDHAQQLGKALHSSKTAAMGGAPIVLFAGYGGILPGEGPSPLLISPGVAYVRLGASYNQQIDAAVAYARAQQRRTAYVLYQPANLPASSVPVTWELDSRFQAVATSFRKAFEADGGHILGTATITADHLSAKTLADIVRLQPDVIYTSATVTPTLFLAKDLRDTAAATKKPLFLGIDSLRVPFLAYRADFSAPMATHTVTETWLFPWGTPDVGINPATQPFLTALKQQYDEEPNGYSPLIYDAARIAINAIATAIKKRDSGPHALPKGPNGLNYDIISNVLATKDYQGAAGPVTFGPHGENTAATASLWALHEGTYMVKKVGQ